MKNPGTRMNDESWSINTSVHPAARIPNVLEIRGLSLI